MRFLHTADWHVGKMLARSSRLDEAAGALSEVVGVARDEKVDAVLLCGDVYEHQAPPPEAEEIVYETLLALEKAGIPVVIIPGNHDAPRRWGAIAPLLRRFSVHIVPEVRRPAEGGVVELPSRDGSTSAQIAALPWVTERRIVTAAEMMGLAEEPGQLYADEMGRLMKALCAGLDPKRCTMFVGHLFVSGAALGGGERSLTVGQTYGVTAQAMPSVQYVALGHVHRPQRVPGSAVPARYAGSLLQLDFSETGHKKSVAIVDLTPGRPADVREVPLSAGRKLLDVTGTMAELAAHAATRDTAFLRVNLVADGPRPGLADQVMGMLPQAVEVRLQYPRTEAEAAVTVRGVPPREQFANYFRERHGASAGDDMLDLFVTLFDEAETA